MSNEKALVANSSWSAATHLFVLAHLHLEVSKYYVEQVVVTASCGLAKRRGSFTQRQQ